MFGDDLHIRFRDIAEKQEGAKIPPSRARVNPRQCRGVGAPPPMSFSGMAAEPLGGSR